MDGWCAPVVGWVHACAVGGFPTSPNERNTDHVWKHRAINYKKVALLQPIYVQLLRWMIAQRG
jgi:hypothetical protein